MAAREEFMGSIRDVSEQIHYADLRGDFKEHARLTGVRGLSMQKYQSHIMYGAKDFQAARSFVVMKMLWGNFRSALANLNALYQIWTDHSSRFGLVQGPKTVGEAAGKGLSNAASVAFQKTMGLVSRGPVEGWESYNPNQRWALNEAMKSGIIDETFAAQLAGFANNSTLERLTKPLNIKGMDSAAGAASRVFDTMKRVGMAPQHLIEVYTRQVGFLSAFDNYMKAGLPKEDALSRATTDTQQLLGDVSKNNRAEYTRGGMAPLTIFASYMQQQMYLFSGAKERARLARDPEHQIFDAKTGRYRAPAIWEKPGLRLGGETARLWATSLAIGGIMGLPGAEDLKGVIKFLGKLLGKDWDLEDQAYRVSNVISARAHEAGWNISPRSFVHGGMQDFSAGGLLPGTDWSGSLSMGSVVPGAASLDKLADQNGMGWIADTMGPLGGMLKQYHNTLANHDMPLYQRAISSLAPNSIGNAYTCPIWEGRGGKGRLTISERGDDL